MRWLLVLTGVTVLVGLRAQEPPLKSGANAGKELAEVQRLLDAGKTAEGVDKLRKLTEESGDDLVTLDGQHYRPLAKAAQAILLSLPPDELRAYRDRVDAPARKLLDAGRAARDPRPLRQLVSRYFPSAQTEDALLTLSDLAFERGDYRSAETYLRRLLPGAAPTDEPSLPAVRTPIAAVRARAILALIFQGDTARAKAELAALNAQHPGAAGHLAGRDGPFAEALQRLLDRPPSTTPEPGPAGDWPTLGGGFERGGQPAARVPKFWRTRATWTATFPEDRERRAGAYPRVAPTRAVALHPVTMNGVGFVADQSRVFGFDLRTGEPRLLADLAGELDGVPRDGKAALPVAVDTDFVLSAAGGRLYARLGPTEVAPPPLGPNGQAVSASVIVCLGPPAGERGGERKGDRPMLQVKWKLAPPAPEGVGAAWEAAPVVQSGRLYAAFVRETPGGLVAALACFPVADTTPDKPLWVTNLADLRPLEKAEPRHRAEPLTLAGGNLIYCSHGGSVVAIDAATGKPSWAYQYPRLPKPGAAARDVNPPVAQGGRVFVAPTDADRVLCLDAVSGKLLWAAEGVQVDQFLGVAAGKLVAAIAAPVRGLRGYDVLTGSDREPAGWRVHDDAQLGSWGRGLLTEDAALWPTKSGVFFVRPSDGLPLAPRLRGPHGNLAFADGVLLVGTPTGVAGYVNDPPDPPDPPDRPLLGALQHDRAEGALRADRPDEARRVWSELLADPAAPTDERARAAARLLSLERPGGGAAALAAFHDRHPAAKPLGEGWVRNTLGVPARLRNLVQDHFGVPPAPPAVEPTRPTPEVPFSPARLPTLDPAAEPVAVHFPSPRCVPLRAFAGPRAALLAGDEPALLLTDGRRLLGFQVSTGKALWERPLPEGAVVTHAEAAEGTVTVAGPNCVLRVALAAGEPAWSLVWPASEPLPGARPHVPPRGAGLETSPALDRFALTASHVVALWGDSHLLGVNRTSGEVDWVCPAGGSARLAGPPPGSPRFTPHYHADDAVVVAQLSTGQCLTVRTATGERLAAAPTSHTPWETPPARYAAGRLAVAEDQGGVRAVEPPHDGRTRATHKLWAWEADGEASLTGRATQLRAAPAGLLAAVSRNHGVTLHRFTLDGRTFRNRGLFLPVGAVDLNAADQDGDATFLPAEGKLFTVRHSDGKAAWGRPAELALEGGVPRDRAWQVVAGRKAVVALPAEAPPVEAWAEVARRVPLTSTLDAARWPGLLASLLDAWLVRRVPLVFLDPATGEFLARRELAAVGPGLAVAAAGNFLVVATAGRAYLLKSP